MIRLWLIMLAVHIPVYLVWGWVLFRHWTDFWEAIGLCLGIVSESPSWDDEEYWHDAWAPVKVAAWFFAPIGLIGFEIRLLGW